MELMVDSRDKEFVCRSFFDVDTQTDGIDVYIEEEKDGKAFRTHLGEIWGLEIPYFDDTEDADPNYEILLYMVFADSVRNWLNENFW